MSVAGKSSNSSRRRDKERKDHREGTGDSSAGRSRHSSGEFTPPELSPTLKSVEVVSPRPGSIDAFVSEYFGSDTSRGTTEFEFSVTLIRHGKAENNSEIRQHLSSQGKSRSRNPKLTRSGICQTRQIATNALVSIRSGTRRAPDIFLKSPLRRAQMSAAWLQAAYEAVAEDWGTRCAVATLDALRECALKADGSIAGSAFPPSEYRIAGKRSTPGDEHWARAEEVDRRTRDELARRYPRDRVTARMTLMRATDLISTLAKIASGFNSRTGQKTCTIEAITHKTLAKGVLDRCRERKVSDATEFNVSRDGLQNAEAQEHTFRVSRTGAGKKPLSIVCTSVRSLPYQATGDDWEEVPTLKDFDSAVREFHKRARRAA